MTEPQPSRLRLPGYDDYLDRGSGLLLWSWLVAAMTDAHNYWVATSSAAGRPHAMPVWGVWLDDLFYFSTEPRTRKGRNLAANPWCVVHTEGGASAAIVEGTAELSRDEAELGRFRAAYEPKYKWDMSETTEVYIVRPKVAFAILETPGDDTGSVTRWLIG